MPATKQTYTVTSPYTALQLAAQFRQAFIDAGLMSEWFDSFTNNSIENRVLEVVYDNRTYGKIYYWFMFSGANVFVHIASGWNAATDTPSGTQYLDFVSNATNTTANHMRFASMNNTVTTTLTRYTSGDVPAFSWFILRNGTTFFNFHISRAAPSSMIDLSRVLYPALFWLQTESQTLRFRRFSPVLRRDHLGTGFRAETSPSAYGGNGSDSAPWLTGTAAEKFRGYSYAFPGNSTNPNNNYSGISNSSVLLPVGFNNVNPAYSADERPIFTGLPLSPYSSAAVLPPDFGVTAIYTANNLDLFSLLVVSATEEWDVLAVQNGTTLGSDPTVAFVARTK